jgi:hypothetical protein
MASASTNIEQGDTQDDVFNCETQDDCGEDDVTNGSETQEASPINANGKRVTRFTQDKGKKPKTRTTLIIQETISSMAMSASSYASEKEGKYSIDEVMEQVLACGANYGSNEHFIATELFINKQ